LLKISKRKRGGLEVGFWFRCVFILGSSPIGGKSRENKNDRKNQIAGNLQFQLFPPNNFTRFTRYTRIISCGEGYSINTCHTCFISATILPLSFEAYTNQPYIASCYQYSALINKVRYMNYYPRLCSGRETRLLNAGHFSSRGRLVVENQE
jgi:hypothetical protein